MYFGRMAHDLRRRSISISIAFFSNFLTLEVIQRTFRLIKAAVHSKIPSKTIIDWYSVTVRVTSICEAYLKCESIECMAFPDGQHPIILKLRSLFSRIIDSLFCVEWSLTRD